MPRKPEKIVDPIDASFDEVVKAIVNRKPPNVRVGRRVTIEVSVTRKRKPKKSAE